MVQLAFDPEPASPGMSKIGRIGDSLQPACLRIAQLGADQSRIELVDFNDVYANVKRRRSEKTTTDKSKTRRTRRGKGKAGAAVAAAAPVAAATNIATSEEE